MTAACFNLHPVLSIAGHLLHPSIPASQLTGESGPVRQSASTDVADPNTNTSFLSQEPKSAGEVFEASDAYQSLLGPCRFRGLILEAHTGCWTTIKQCPRTFLCLAPDLSFDLFACYLGRRRAHCVGVGFQLVTPRQEFPLSPLRTIPQ